ncbi:MAG: hypothetical protein HOK84_16650, partial [Bacteroidetes bacterium]|nr:hypothetical protein [Bacteroidota bacterium]
RTSCLLEVFEDGNKVDFGYSPSSNDDNNNFLKFKLKKNTSYEFILSDQGQADYKKKIPILTNNEAIQDIALIFK